MSYTNDGVFCAELFRKGLEKLLLSDILPARSYSGRQFFSVRYTDNFHCSRCHKKLLSSTVCYSGGHGHKLCLNCSLILGGDAR